MNIKRRELLKAGALMAAGAAVIASGVPLVAPGEDWTSSLKRLDRHQGETLLKMSRRIFPHDRLDDAYYIKVVSALDTEAVAYPNVASLLRQGVEQLDGAQGGGFASLPPGQQVAVLTSMQTTTFFQKVRATELLSLYGNPDVWKHFGYQGPSFQHGGYIHRGFDDLRWLPNPPESASPKVD